MLRRRRRGPIRPRARPGSESARRSAAGRRRGAGRHREADAAHGRRYPARAVRRPHTFHRGAAAGTRSRRPARRAVGDRRPPARRLRRGVRHAPARLRSPRVRLRRRRVPHPDRRESRGVFVALRGRRNRLRTAHRTPVQLQQPAGCLSPLRGLRQDHRHRRGSGHPRQEQDDLRRRHRLLARRDHAPVEGEAGGERRQVRLPDPHALPRTDARTEAPAMDGQRILLRSGQLLRIHRQRTAQDSVPRDEGALHGQDALPRMRRQPPAQGSALRARGRPHDRRSGDDERRRAAGVLQGIAARRTRYDHRTAHPHRNRQPVAIPRRRGTGLSDARPPELDAFGRRVAAHQPGHVAGQQPRRFALHSRRTLDRPASARHEPAGGRAQTIARHRQHRHRGRTRGGGDPCGRLDRRRRPRSGLQRRRDRFLRPREKTFRLPEKPHGRLPGRTAADRTALDAARVEPFDRRQGGAGEQPAKHRRALSAGSHDLRHGRQRLGQVVARQGNPLPGTAAHALRHGNQTGRLRRAGRRRTTAQIGRNGRPEPDRKVDALESRHLHQSLR